MPKGSDTWKAVVLEAIGRAEREPAGCFDCGTAEEDGPVTWEAPARPHVERHRDGAMGVGLRPGGKPSEKPPNPKAVRRYVFRPGR